MPETQLTLQQFGATIKKKYPQYASKTDDEVGSAMLKKYPQYQNKVKVGDTSPTATATQKPGETPDYLGAIGNFLAPTATKTLGKIAKGENVGLRDVAGSALEVGSYLVPVGAIGRLAGLGVKGIKALSLARKAATGAAIGGVSGGLLEAGRATGEEGTTIPQIAERALGGSAAGALGGAALPLGGAALVGAAKKVVPAASIAARGTKNLVSNTAGRIGGTLQEEAAIRALPEDQKTLRRSGFDERSTNFLTKATPKTKQGFKEMIAIAERGSTDPRYRVQPKQVLGKSFLNRVDTIQQDSVKARNEINTIAKQPKQVSIVPAVREFESALNQRGLSMNADGRLVSKGSLPSSELKYYENILKEIKQVTGGRSVVSNTQAHKLRQRLFETLESEAKKGTMPGVRPFSDKVDQDVNIFRGALSKALGPKYQAAAKRFAENEKTLRDVAKYAGVPNDWQKISSKDLKFGEILFRTLGNAADKPLSLLNDVEKVAHTRGGKFSDNILDLADFADSLEEIYGISKSRGFEGGIARGVQQGQGGMDAPTGVTQAVLRAVQAAFKTNNEDKIRALKKVLRYKD